MVRKILSLLMLFSLSMAVYAAEGDHGEENKQSPATLENAVETKSKLVEKLRLWFPVSEADAPIFAERIMGSDETAAHALANLMGSMKAEFRKKLYDDLWEKTFPWPTEGESPYYQKILWAAYKEVNPKHLDKESAEKKKLSATTDAFSAAYDKAREAKKILSEQYQKLAGELAKATTEEERARIIGELEKLGFKPPTQLAYANLHGATEAYRAEAGRALDVAAGKAGVLHLEGKDGMVNTVAFGPLNDPDRQKRLNWTAALMANPGGNQPNPSVGEVPTLWNARPTAAPTDPKKQKKFWAQNANNDGRFTFTNEAPPPPKNPIAGAFQIPTEVPKQNVGFNDLINRCNKCHIEQKTAQVSAVGNQGAASFKLKRGNNERFLDGTSDASWESMMGADFKNNPLYKEFQAWAAAAAKTPAK